MIRADEMRRNGQPAAYAHFCGPIAGREVVTDDAIDFPGYAKQ